MATAITTDKVFRWALGYDVLLRALWGGAERDYRERVVALAGLRPGEAVLDVGCGTGSLAIAARRRGVAEGRVHGVDASPAMIARARRKAAAAGMPILFERAAAQSLPFAEADFDVVLTTTVLHCLAQPALPRALGEMRRVLRPGGRLLAVDFGGGAAEKRSLMGRLHHHRRFDLRDLLPLLRETGFASVETGALGFSDLHYARAVA